MAPKLPRFEHYSYLRHRKQRTTQIILPVAISALAMVVAVILISLATFNSGGDVARWAAVSTIWLAIPVLLGGLITLALLAVLVYGMSRALSALPHYTGIAQDYVYVAHVYVIRWVDIASNAMIQFKGYVATVKSFLQRIVP